MSGLGAHPEDLSLIGSSVGPAGTAGPAPAAGPVGPVEPTPAAGPVGPAVPGDQHPADLTPEELGDAKIVAARGDALSRFLVAHDSFSNGDLTTARATLLGLHDARANFLLAVCANTERDIRLYNEYLLEAARHGMASAQFLLGCELMPGITVSADMIRRQLADAVKEAQREWRIRAGTPDWLTFIAYGKSLEQVQAARLEARRAGMALAAASGQVALPVAEQADREWQAAFRRAMNHAQHVTASTSSQHTVGKTTKATLAGKAVRRPVAKTRGNGQNDE